MLYSTTFVLVSAFAGQASAHLAAYAKGMYCQNGFNNGARMSGNDALNSNAPVTPVYQMSFKDWWFHGVNGCPNDPPPEGEFLELPAGKSFQVELASNRGKTTMAWDGKFTSEWPDGNNYPADYHVDSCIISPNMHTKDQNGAAGTAFAISYESDISKVSPDNLAVFSVRYHTPWKRITSYDVPANLPACPEGGCICAWGWVPNGCGEPNMFHGAFKCKVTGATSSTPVAKPKPPVWCEGDANKCVKGSKQMIYWHQNEGNNMEISGLDNSGQPKSPGYNMKVGFSDGAQNDIFDGEPMPSGGSSSPSSGSSSNNSGSSNNQSQSGSSGSNSGSNNSQSGSGSGSSNQSGSGSSNQSSSGSTSSSTQASSSNNNNESSSHNTNTDSGSSSSSSTPAKSPSAKKCKKRRSTPLERGLRSHRSSMMKSRLS